METILQFKASIKGRAIELNLLLLKVNFTFAQFLTCQDRQSKDALGPSYKKFFNWVPGLPFE